MDILNKIHRSSAHEKQADVPNITELIEDRVYFSQRIYELKERISKIDGKNGRLDAIEFKIHELQKLKESIETLIENKIYEFEYSKYNNKNLHFNEYSGKIGVLKSLKFMPEDISALMTQQDDLKIVIIGQLKYSHNRPYPAYHIRPFSYRNDDKYDFIVNHKEDIQILNEEKLVICTKCTHVMQPIKDPISVTKRIFQCTFCKQIIILKDNE